MSEAAIESVAAEPVGQAAEPVLSVSEHAAQFNPAAPKVAPVADESEEAPEGETDAEREERIHHSAAQKREADTGKWKDGKQRKSKDLVERVNALTGRAKGAEERAAVAERQLADANAEVARLKAMGAPKTEINRANADARHAFDERNDADSKLREVKRLENPADPSDPEPQEADIDDKFGGDYAKFLKAQARWEARQEMREQREREEREVINRQVAEISKAQVQKFNTRVDAARQKYSDFDAAANEVIQRVPQGSIIESWMFEHPKAEDVVYMFHSHPQELDAILQMPTAIEQIEAVTLLAQRFASPQNGSAGTTGSATVRKMVSTPPKPPNPVRTEAQRSSDGPPLDGSLSVSEHARRFKLRH